MKYKVGDYVQMISRPVFGIFIHEGKIIEIGDVVKIDEITTDNMHYRFKGSSYYIWKEDMEKCFIKKKNKLKKILKDENL